MTDGELEMDELEACCDYCNGPMGSRPQWESLCDKCAADPPPICPSCGMYTYRDKPCFGCKLSETTK